MSRNITNTKSTTKITNSQTSPSSITSIPTWITISTKVCLTALGLLFVKKIIDKIFTQHNHNPQPDSNTDGQDMRDSNDHNKRDDGHNSGSTNENTEPSQGEEYLLLLKPYVLEW